jgi:hypothetical protein
LVKVEGALQHCPLCGTKLTENQSSERSSYPKYETGGLNTALALSVFWTKVFPCILVGAFLIPSLLTIITGEGNLWVNSQTLGIASAWVLVRYTLMSQMHKGKKFLLQIANISLALFIIDKITNQKGWALNYAIPVLLIASTLAMLFVVYKNKRLWSDYAVYLLTLIFLGFFPCFLYVINVTRLLWPSALAAGFAAAALIAIYGFLDKKFLSFFHRRLHF